MADGRAGGDQLVLMLARVTITASDTTHVTEIETTSAVLAVGNVVPT